MQENHAEQKYYNFIDIYTKHYNTAYPDKIRQKRKNERNNPEPWITPWLEDACNRKNRLYYEFVSKPTAANKMKYTKMKNFVEKHIKKTKNKYYSKYFEQYKCDSRKQWSMINNLLNRNRKTAAVKKLIDKDGNIVRDEMVVGIFW